MKLEELKSLLKSWIGRKPDWSQLSLYNVLSGVAVALTILTLWGIYTILSSSPEVSARAAAKEQRLVYDIAADQLVKGGSVREYLEEKKEGKETTLEILETKSEQELAPETKPGEEKSEPEKEASSEKEVEEGAKPEQEPEASGGNATNKQAKSRIAIIIIGVGISKSSSEAVANLPAGINLAISPYSHFADTIINAASSAKRNYLVEIPSEPKDYPITDPGPYSLLCENQLVENLSHLEWAMGRVKGSVAAVLPMDEKFSQCTENASGVFAKLAEMDVKLLITTPEAEEQEAIKSSKVKTARANLVIDSTIDAGAIDANLAELEKSAQENGLAIGIARPYPISLKAISKWSESLADKGFELIPATAVFESSGQ